MRSPVPALRQLADAIVARRPASRDATNGSGASLGAWQEPAPLHPLPTAPPVRGVRGIGGDQPGPRLTLEAAEAILRRYQGRPPRIANPFAAFPTRAHWLARLMDDDALD